MKDLLFGLVANRTGVIENQSGLFDRGHLAVSLGQKRTDDLFRVVHIHLATEDFQIERFLSLSRHGDSSIAPCGCDSPSGFAPEPGGSCRWNRQKLLNAGVHEDN